MADERSKGGELVLATGQFALVLDRTKGNVSVYVGPSKTSLSETDQPILWDPSSQTHRPCEMKEAIRPFINAPEGAYVVLTNPARDSNSEHPKEGSANSLIPLNMGKKVNVRGPASFALWFQQTGDVVTGHHLRTNQYLVVQVYNEEAAKNNWAQAVIRRQKPTDKKDPLPPEGEQKPPEGGVANPPQTPPAVAVSQDENKPPVDLAMGQRFVLMGTDLSFYIPPTGMEVLKDEKGNYVREAVSLEQLEYCVLLNEGGAKRFVHGPAVVFPSPTETFMEVDGRRKFKAIELNPHSGIYVKVTEAYEEDGQKYTVGQELFITGKTQAIYFPRREHAFIKYGEQSIHYAVAIPAGEGRYVLNRDNGKVDLVKGPAMLLPDPRTQVIARRILDTKQVELWYPGNTRAVQVNTELAAAARESGVSTTRSLLPTMGSGRLQGGGSELGLEAVVGDAFGRKSGFTPPRTVTLDNKYDGAVEVNVWSGYAVLVVSKTGTRQVIQGPTTKLLEFDETLGATELSTGTPKMSDRPIKTAYLRVLNNRVSDEAEAETNDLVKVRVKLSYRVNFEGEPAKWFDVENYIQFLCDHTRSLIRNMVKKLGIQEFHRNAIDLVRDAVLGKSEGDKPRAGRVFKENGMRIYDVEVLDVIIDDSEISSLLVGEQHRGVQQYFRVTRAQQELVAVKEEQKVARERRQEESATTLLGLTLQKKAVEEETVLAIAKASQSIKVQEAQEHAKAALQEILTKITMEELERAKVISEQDMAVLARKQELALQAEASAAAAIAKKLEGFTPPLVAALQAFGDKDLAIKVAGAMAPLAILREKGVGEAFAEMVKGTSLEHALGTLLQNLTQKPSAG